TMAETGATLFYAFDLVNNGAAAMRNLQVTETITIGHQTVRQRVIATPDVLAPYGSLHQPHRFDIPPIRDLIGEALTVSIDVEGSAGGKHIRVSGRQTTIIDACKLVVEVTPMDAYAFLGQSFRYSV